VQYQHFSFDTQPRNNMTKPTKEIFLKTEPTISEIEERMREDIESYDLNQIAKWNPYFREYVCSYFQSNQYKQQIKKKYAPTRK